MSSIGRYGTERSACVSIFKEKKSLVESVVIAFHPLAYVVEIDPVFSGTAVKSKG